MDRSQDDQESMQIEQEELGKWTSDNAHLCNITPHNSDSQEIDVLPAAFKDCFFSDEFFQLTMNVKNMRNAFLEMLVAVLTQIEAAPLCKATQKDEIAMVLPVHWAWLTQALKQIVEAIKHQELGGATTGTTQVHPRGLYGGTQTLPQQ